MKIESEQKFVPVIITLESQEEIDSLFAVANHGKIINALPALSEWWDILKPFVDNQALWDKLDANIK